MNYWLDEAGKWRPGAVDPPIRSALALSLVVHIVALWSWLPRLNLPSLDGRERGEMAGSLVVQLVQPSAIRVPVQPHTPHALTARREHAPIVHAPAARATPPPSPPVLALARPAPEAPAQPSARAPSPATAASPPAGGDLAGYIEARRRARGESAPQPLPAQAGAPAPSADDEARSNRIVASNLGTQRKLTFGYDPTRGGGMFQITHLSEDSADFLFFGWDNDIRRNTKQYIEVRKGDAADIRWAVIRKMIAIIRDHEQGDFLWESWRLGQYVPLSARPRDSAELEGFLMREFFPDARLAR